METVGHVHRKIKECNKIISVKILIIFNHNIKEENKWHTEACSEHKN